jgi:hypothetical protein
MPAITIINDVISTDSDGTETTDEVLTNYTVELVDGTFTATETETGILEIEQPFNFEPDGTRIDWADSDTAVAWFKEIKNHTGD